MVTTNIKILFIFLFCSLNSYSFQQLDSLTFNHKEVTFETSFLKNNKANSGSYSAAFSYLFKISKRLELGPQLSIASYNIDSLGRFYPLALRGHIKYYFGDLLKMKPEWINKLYATSKFGLAYELKDKNFINSDQYIGGIGTEIIFFKNKTPVIFEFGVSEIALYRNDKKFFRNAFTVGVNYKF